MISSGPLRRALAAVGAWASKGGRALPPPPPLPTALRQRLEELRLRSLGGGGGGGVGCGGGGGLGTGRGSPHTPHQPATATSGEGPLSPLSPHSTAPYSGRARTPVTASHAPGGGVGRAPVAGASSALPGASFSSPGSRAATPLAGTTAQYSQQHLQQQQQQQPSLSVTPGVGSASTDSTASTNTWVGGYSGGAGGGMESGAGGVVHSGPSILPTLVGGDDWFGDEASAVATLAAVRPLVEEWVRHGAEDGFPAPSVSPRVRPRAIPQPVLPLLSNNHYEPPVPTFVYMYISLI